MVLNAIRTHGLEAVPVACELALEANAVSGDYVLNAPNRFTPQPTPPKSVRAMRQRPPGEV